MEMTSKRQVSRRREILPVKKIEYRDPRFDSLAGPLDEARAQKAYAFLDDYRDDEMKQLRAAVKKAKTPREKEELQRALMSMESKKKAKDRKERERAVIEEHRKQEKELVKQGKKPFYLKKSEQKKRLLLDQFANMSEKQVEKAIEKKRKKVAAKEKKEMPFARRGAEER
ncbi:putative rrna processing protein [Phaeoacremonium minimum UCRPA7]|uniref:rRNA biogenesis protein RRP36 n=1 Tax=Phaeoacremonium minimum (strain UCR-PA7) TaxID=1286976 RepID=R8BA48_PHAM7|nr:putative rrna processing protein [Phaeoacremonium minimum UCRPA7]EON96168.1 putative rrna processing protein [Phaeoacremonium minimum UCRPA7]